MTLIRIKKTEEVAKVLDYLRKDKYILLSDAELIKTLLSKQYTESVEDSMRIEDRIADYKRITNKTFKLGEALLKQKGLKEEDLSEEDLINLIDED
jgi:hypothetical protein